ncbi:MAG: hypothetical protein LIR50_15890 [Bacillota bacterium]|nr:hypothetical protein [Bacillota bacterium]
MKRKISIGVISIICVVILVAIGFYFGKSTTNKKAVITSDTLKQQKVNNSIDGFDLGVLNKDQFHKAISLGEKYKNTSTIVKDVNLFQNSIEDFKDSYVFGISVGTPFAEVVSTSAELAKNYETISEDTVIKKIREDKTSLNNLMCVATVGGDEPDFAKEDNIVVTINNNDGTKKILHADYLSNGIDHEEMTSFFPDKPMYKNSIAALFNIKDFTNIKSIEVKIIQPNRPEVNRIFDYDTLNQL